MSKVRLGVAAIFVAVAATSLAACSDDDNSSTNTPAPATTTAEPSASAPAQTVTISPAGALKDKQVVTLTGKGYTAGKQYGATECANKGAATGAADCNLHGIKVGVADASGTVTIQFTVAKTFNTPVIDCTKDPGCIVSIANAGTAAPTEVATADLDFS
jgi:hypothetical protein